MAACRRRSNRLRSARVSLLSAREDRGRDSARGRWLAARLEMHYTPEHGSWLNVAEIEQSVLARQALGRRIPTLAAIQRAVTAWAERRNRKGASVDWQFTLTDARIKLKRLYPKIDD